MVLLCVLQLKLILNSEIHEDALTLVFSLDNNLQATHFLMFVFLPLLLQDISAHESNILGSFCDMNVSNLEFFLCLQREFFT